MSLNKVQLIGHLGNDVGIRHSVDGGRIANFPLATSESWHDKSTGEKKTKTEWHKIVVFNDRLADVCEKYLKKGSKVFLEGQLQTRKWTNKDGRDVYTTEVVLGKYKGEIILLDSGVKTEPVNNENFEYDDLPF